jgi:HPt (histidine-containing phosphotransfer) domain-containing protein
LIGVFANDSERLMAEIRDAIEKGAASKLGRAAHTIKSMVQFFSATEAADAARRLEMMGNDGDLEGAAEQYGRLVEELGHLRPILLSLRSEGKP